MAGLAYEATTLSEAAPWRGRSWPPGLLPLPDCFWDAACSNYFSLDPRSFFYYIKLLSLASFIGLPAFFEFESFKLAPFCAGLLSIRSYVDSHFRTPRIFPCICYRSYSLISSSERYASLSLSSSSFALFSPPSDEFISSISSSSLLGFSIFSSVSIY